MYIYIDTYIHEYTTIYARTHVRTHAHSYSLTHSHLFMHMHTRTHKFLHVIWTDSSKYLLFIGSSFMSCKSYFPRKTVQNFKIHWNIYNPCSSCLLWILKADISQVLDP